MKHLLIFSLIIILSTACQSPSEDKDKRAKNTLIANFELQETNTKASLRGISVVNEEVIWASGSHGTVLRTTNGGEKWQTIKVSEADNLDFRDIEAFDSLTAFILSAGSPARLYKTNNGGENWELQYENLHPQAFFDGLAFWDEKLGFAMSDPIDGEFLIIKTEDGEHWKEIANTQLPNALEGEGGYAASGTNVAVAKGGLAWFATGGPAGRIFRSEDYAESWEVFNTPVHSELPYSGIYSIAFKDKQHGIAVGGTFTKPDTAIHNAAISNDGGKNWQLLNKNGPQGYRSCVAYLPHYDIWITVSRTGGEISYDQGKNWKKFTEEIYYSISIGEKSRFAWVSGPEGKIAKITFKNVDEN